MNEQSAPPAPPQPTAEHRRLAEHAGQWNVECDFYMDPSQPPMRVPAREKVELFGGFWTVSQFECDMFGAPYKGRASLGYDPLQGKYVSTWIDTMSPAIFLFTGSFDASGKVLEMTGEGPDCTEPGLAKYRTREEHVSRDERVFEMFVTLPTGAEVQMFRHHYRRAK